jgi:DNA polymerase sigma
VFFFDRQTIQKELETHIRTEYADAVLSMFGSSCNGFGFADSDVDLCLTFESNEDGKVNKFWLKTRLANIWTFGIISFRYL